jgi:hypothetical protein
MPGIFGKIFGAGAGEILKPVSDILDNLTTNKEEKIKAQAELEKVLNDYLIQKEQIANTAVEMYLKDIQDSRAMQRAAAGSDDKFVRRFVYWFAIIIIISCFAMMTLILLNQIPQESKDFAYLILGTLTGMLTSVVAFFFGSTKGSDSKNEAIKNLSKPER